MGAVKAYKAERGIAPDAQDFHETGMIGEEFNEITTRWGGGGKAHHRESGYGGFGVRPHCCTRPASAPGTPWCAGFSGSFPAMNLAVITACEAMGVKLVYIASVGAPPTAPTTPRSPSRNGALLVRDGLITADCAAAHPGRRGRRRRRHESRYAFGHRGASCGGRDLLSGTYPTTPGTSRPAAAFTRTPVFAALWLWAATSPPWGRAADAVSLGQGVSFARPLCLYGEKSGLVQRYLADGLPVINLLNIKKLTADYGMPYDPAVWPAEGTGAVYTETAFPRPLITACLAAAAALLFYLRLFCRKTVA
jgi:hypothetical protein